MTRPGLDQRRLVRLMRDAIARLHLDLEGACVLTEAATGAYAVTPVLAALAGARRVTAFTRPTRHGTVDEVAAETATLAALAGVKGIELVTERSSQLWGEGDVVTNSGHLRPLDRAAIEAMKPGAVIPLMFENWEYRPADLDFAAASERGIPVAGTNERHPEIDVFSYLGSMAVRLMHDARIPVYGSRVLVVCDNPFAPYLAQGLAAAGAVVEVVERLPEMQRDVEAVLVATSPGRPVVGPDEARRLSQAGAPVVLQYWGEVDRDALEREEVPVWPLEAPLPGHMGVLLSEIGPEPVVRLQAGGLKVGGLLWNLRRAGVSGVELGRRLAETTFGELLSPETISRESPLTKKGSE